MKELESNKLKSFKAVSPDPAKFWKGAASNYPILGRVARKLLPIQATSAHNERDFSRAGQIRTAKRALFFVAKVRQIDLLGSVAANGLIKLFFFLNFNLDFVWNIQFSLKTGPGLKFWFSKWVGPSPGLKFRPGSDSGCNTSHARMFL